ncbi:hypothetical protein [Ligilactobacillus ruminis]
MAQVKDASVKIEEIQGQVMTSLESISSQRKKMLPGRKKFLQIPKRSWQR